MTVRIRDGIVSVCVCFFISNREHVRHVSESVSHSPNTMRQKHSKRLYIWPDLHSNCYRLSNKYVWFSCTCLLFLFSLTTNVWTHTHTRAHIHMHTDFNCVGAKTVERQWQSSVKMFSFVLRCDLYSDCFFVYVSENECGIREEIGSNSLRFLCKPRN